MESRVDIFLRHWDCVSLFTFAYFTQSIGKISKPGKGRERGVDLKTALRVRRARRRRGVAAGWVIPILKKRGSHSFPSFASNVFVRLMHSSVKQWRLGLKFWSDFYIILEFLGWIMLTNLIESQIVCFSSSFSCH